MPSLQQVEESPDVDGRVHGEWSGFLCQVWVDQFLRSLVVESPGWRFPKRKKHGMFQGTLRKNETYEQYGPQKQSKTYPSVIKHVIYMESTSYRWFSQPFNLHLDDHFPAFFGFSRRTNRPRWRRARCHLRRLPAPNRKSCGRRNLSTQWDSQGKHTLNGSY